MTAADADRLEFRLLGPVEVVRAGEQIRLRGRTLAVLAGLLLSPNKTISADELAALVWEERLPDDPRSALFTTVYRLRRRIGAAAVESIGGGYRINVESTQLDLLRFNELAAAATTAGSEGDIEGALSYYDEALRLWRGAPLSNLDAPALRRDAESSLTELLLTTCERWAQYSLDLGRVDAVVARLTVLVSAHPFRERLAGQLITALFRGGRQAEALAAYERVRDHLRQELGVTPGKTLQELHLRILRSDEPVPGPRVEVR